MPVVVCPHCRASVRLPDPWPSDGYTCPHCRRPSQLPRMVTQGDQPPMPVVDAPLPLQIQSPPPRRPSRPRHTVTESHTYDHTPKRNSFLTGLGGSLGCVLGTAFGIILLCAGVLALIILPLSCVVRDRVKEIEQRSTERGTAR